VTLILLKKPKQQQHSWTLLMPWLFLKQACQNSLIWPMGGVLE
jgi:hypothetical protein